MSIAEIISKIEALKEMEALIREAETEAEKLREEIKAEMTAKKTEEMIVGRYIVRWTSVSTNRFDSKALKAEMAKLYDRYVKQTKSKRFSIVG